MRYLQHKFLALALISLSPLQVSGKGFKSITVLDSNFQPVAHLKEPTQISQFEKFWSSREISPDDIKPSWGYKLDLNPGGRWLYSPKGYFRRLTKSKTKLYKLSNPREFNTLLNIND